MNEETRMQIHASPGRVRNAVRQILSMTRVFHRAKLVKKTQKEVNQ